MTGIKQEHITMLHFLWLLPLVLGIYIYAAQKRKQALRVFIDSGLLARIPISVSSIKRRWKAGLVLIAMTFIIVAMTRPAWNPKPKTVERRGRDIVFLLDVSKSMLAEDLVPNRLERAKLAIRDCLETLEGDRVALVVFAGTAAVKCPLTLDYGFFKMMLDRISVNSIARGGTMIGDAIRRTMEDVFDDQLKQYKDLILITDGEDHDSFPVEAATQAGERGMRLLIIGLGDENEGKRIPITDENGRRKFMKHNGQEIWTRLDADTLRKMANATPGGKYLNVATGVIDLGDVYTKLIASAEKRDLEAKTIKQYEEKFQIFIAIAIAILFLERMIGEARKVKQVTL